MTNEASSAPVIPERHLANWRAWTPFRHVLRSWSAMPVFAQRLLLFLIVACVHFYFAHARNDRHLYYDAQEYWGAASSFSLKTYTMPLRGYSYPFFCLALRTIAKTMGVNEFIVLWTVNSLISSAFGTVLVPGLVRRLLPQARIGVLGILAFNALLLLFYRGYTSYSLTDIPSLTLLVLALWCLLSSARWSVVGGTAMALAINVRPIYVIALVGLGILICWRLFDWFRARQLRLASVWVLGLLLGLGLGLGPQVYVNHHNSALLSILPPTDQRYGKSLYLWQLEVGLSIQRYETNVGTAYPLPQVRFHDRVGATVASARKTSFADYSDWLKFLRKYPRSMVAVYGRHFFNGLDVTYPTPYLKDPYKRPFWGPLINYSVLFLFLARLRHVRPELLRNIPFLAALACILLPALAAIPTAVEVRYFLPIHSIVFASVALGGVLSLSNLRRVKFIHVFYFLLFLLMCHTMSDTTFGSLEHLKVLR